MHTHTHTHTHTRTATASRVVSYTVGVVPVRAWLARELRAGGLSWY